MNQKPLSVEEYLAAVPANQERALQRLREQIRKDAPNAEERIAYGIPAFYQNGYLIAYGSAKKHCSLFPGAEPIAKLADRLKGYSLSKGTIRFAPEQPLPDDLVSEIVHLCLQRNAAKTGAMR